MTTPPHARFPRPANLTKEERNAYYDEVKRVFNLLYTMFPNLFHGKGLMPPLARGIDEQIAEYFPQIDRAVLNGALKKHTQRRAYLASLTVATHRFNLDGSQAEEIEARHKVVAKNQVRKSIRRMKARKQETEARKRKKQNARKIRAK